MKLCYVTQNGTKTDLCILLSGCAEVIEYSTREFAKADIDCFDSFVFDGIDTDNGLSLLAPERENAEKAVLSGKSVFASFCPFLSTVCCSDPVSTRYARPVVVKESDGLELGDLIDEQSNKRLSCYTADNANNPILYYLSNPKGYYKTQIPEKFEIGNSALWFEKSSYLFCTFAMGNFAKACFAPRKKIYSLISLIVAFLTSKTPLYGDFNALCEEQGYSVLDCRGELTDELKNSTKTAIDWHYNSDMFIKRDDKIIAIREGLAGGIDKNGGRSILPSRTTEANGGTAEAFYYDWLYTKNSKSKSTADALRSYAQSHILDFDNSLDGFSASGDGGWWHTCYGDGSAKALIIPSVMRSLIEKKEIEPQIKRAIDFLVRSTGKDGLRYCSTIIKDEKKAVMSSMCVEYYDNKWHWGQGITGTPEEMASVDSGCVSGHYNGYYLASLFLAYKLTKNKEYLETALKGTESIMSVYPNTAREHSETQENSRLVLPNAYRYWITRDGNDKRDLDKIAEYFETLYAKTVAFTEWDTNQQAVCSGTVGTESSVLCKNGDPVCDLLYSQNWLPNAFIHAYYITGEERWFSLYEKVSRFLVSAQLRSKNPLLNGAWARGFDSNLREVYGVQNDVGWAPWSIECGWMSGQIPVGFYMWLLKDTIKPLFE